MDSALFFILGIAAFGVITAGFIAGERLVRYWGTQKDLEQLDPQIWALESGAEEVSYRNDHGWLDLVILAKDMNFRVIWRARRVTTEIHHQYKAYNFSYAPLYNLGSNRSRGVIVQFKDDVPVAHFAMVRKGVRVKLEDGNAKLALSVYNLVPGELEFIGQPADSRQIYDFLREKRFFAQITDHPQWERLYVRDNFTGVYFRSGFGRDEALHKHLFGIDEQIARTVLGDTYEPTDPAVEIRLLKDENGGV